MGDAYVHGYHQRERDRLHDQAGTLVDFVHTDVAYDGGSRVLEVGCGVGAQTITLAQRSPTARVTAIDIAAESLVEAKRRVTGAGITNVQFGRADLFALPFKPESFGHIFVCFVLEHLARPIDALVILRGLLARGGTITVIEGDHGSTHFYPESAAADRAVDCLVRLQRMAGGNALIGRQLYPLLTRAGFDRVRVTPRLIHVEFARA